MIFFLDKYTLYPSQLVSHENFLYQYEWEAAYYYISTVPQWTSLNREAWKDIENEIRLHATFEQVNLTVITGAYNVMMLPNKNKMKCNPIYLHFDETGPHVAVPQAIWKAVIDEKNKAGIAFIAINNPYRLPAHNYLCTDISSELPWFYYNTRRFPSSKIYACEISELRQLIPYIADYEVNNLMHFRDRKIKRAQRRRYWRIKGMEGIKFYRYKFD